MGEWKEKKNRAPDLKYLERESLKKGDSDTGTAADVELVMKKYDRESNTRVWQGKPASIIRWLSVLFSVYSIYVTLFSTALPEIRLSMFLGMILILGYLHYPVQKGDGRINHMPWYDWVLMAVGAVPFFYFAANAHAIIKLATRVTKNPVMVLMAILAVLSLMELCRRCVGIPILCVVGALLVYTFATVRFGKVIYDLFYTTSGVMNTPINVCAKYIVVFIIFGAFLERTGISNFFIDLANCLCGSSAGGPAKVAVISSALCGMVSGSSVGVEAAASTGGQIMPPIMGAAAFLMAEYMGVPYATVALKAILPAVLYFAGIYIAVHLEAQKLGLRGIPREELPQMRVLMKQIYLLAPLIVLVVLVSTNTFTMQFSASVAIFAAIAVGALNRNNRITLKKIVDALEAGGRGTITVAVACAMAGLVAGCITSTGLASKLITAIVAVSQGKPLIALFLTMLCCIVLGMGVPTTATYCIMAATCAPILMSPEIGVEMLAAHFFVFYFGIVADITPPVALAAYAGAAIAKAGPMKTAFNASRLAIAAFIVPYIIAMNPAMLFINTTIPEVVMITITSIIGIFGVAAGLSGFVFRNMKWWERILCIVGGLTLLVPGSLTDLIGLVLVGAVCVLGYQAAKKEKEVLVV